MKLGLMFAGQGSQKPGMGRDLYEREPIFRAAWDAADPGHVYRELCFNGTQEALNDTRNTQPCMVTFAVAMTALLRENGVVPDMTCGLSLGEYGALACAGVFEPAQAVALAAFRGEAMTDAGRGLDTRMAAVLGLSADALETVCAGARDQGVVEIANRNCPGQLVISGEAAAVDAVCVAAKEAGAKKCVPLAVSGAFHTSLMRPAAEKLAERFTRERFGEMVIPVVFNCVGRTMADGETVPVLLERQVRSGVRFEETIRFMAAQGVDTVWEIGPGRALNGFVRRTEPSMTMLGCEDTATFDAALTAWRDLTCKTAE